MLKVELIRSILTISLASGVIVTLTVQKIKGVIKKKINVFLMSIAVSMTVGTLFCKCFSSANWLYSTWGGFFTWLDSQLVYEALKNKVLKTHDKLTDTEEIERDDRDD